MTSVLYRGSALADGRSHVLTLDVDLLVADGEVRGLWPGGAPVGTPADQVVDASGTTLVPGLVDCHNHLTLAGGARWMLSGTEDREGLLAVAEESGEALHRAGVAWVRDTGSPQRDGSAVSLAVRESWRGRRDRPRVASAGTWLAATGVLAPHLAVHVTGGEELLRAAGVQVDDGADLVKIYLQGPDGPPFTPDEVAAVVALAHDRGAKVAAHAGSDAESLVGARAGVDSVEHAFELSDATIAVLADQGVTLVSTLGVMHSVRTFASTTTGTRWSGQTDEVDRRLPVAESAVARAFGAGVRIAAGSDAGGGSLRHGLLAWEVEALVRAGLPGCDALAAVTWRAGELLGEPSAGRLAVGDTARGLFVHGNPLEDPSALWRVWRVL